MSAAKRLRIEREKVLKGGRKQARIINSISNINNDDDNTQNTQNTQHNSNNEDLNNDNEDPNNEDPEATSEALTSLMDKAEQLKESFLNKTEEEKQTTLQSTAEERLLKEANTVSSNALSTASQAASGIVYTEPYKTSWTAPKYILDQGPDHWQSIRDKWSILVEGEDITPPMRRFQDMKLPKPILDSLKSRNITRPTPIQMQGLPLALAGRDLVGIAFTGSGKTVTFVLPLVMAAMEEEKKMPLIANEGPVGIVMAPSRELARQTYDVVVQTSAILTTNKSSKYPSLRHQLLIGGEDKRSQLETLQSSGIHTVVATPGRLKDFLTSNKMNLDICRYLCLDEADRMLDMGFDEDVSQIVNCFKSQRQTLLFSATFPKKFQDFAMSTLVKPVIVNVGRAGAANLDVIQEVEYVKSTARIVYLLECLQKTPPPVCVFCERKGDVDDIHEYLLLKGVEAVSIHGGKDQAERNEAIDMFKDGRKDVLVSTDVAAKGLDFPDIQHVINFDMPSEIENYVHRIGRTGRCGKTGVATTFVDKSVEESTLLDLKHLLIEAKQRVPPVLEIMEDPAEAGNVADLGGKGCAFCGGLGHRITECPKLEKDARRVAGGKKDALNSGDGYGGDW